MTVEVAGGLLGDSAVFSDCGEYRYALRRRWGDPESPSVLFVMLNPSTADETVNDRTVARCIDYAHRWGFGGLSVANLYAYRSKHPEDLRDLADPVGPENDEWIARLAHFAGRIVVAWGAWAGPDKLRPERVSNLILGGRHGLLAQPALQALKLTKSGAPWHPLYVRGDAQLVPWTYRLDRRAA